MPLHPASLAPKCTSIWCACRLKPQDKKAPCNWFRSVSGLTARPAKMRAHRGSNTGPHDLQSYALPLSYRALVEFPKLRVRPSMSVRMNSPRRRREPVQHKRRSGKGTIDRAARVVEKNGVVRREESRREQSPRGGTAVAAATPTDVCSPLSATSSSQGRDVEDGVWRLQTATELVHERASVRRSDAAWMG